jgi:hypothetical protein
MMCSSASWTTIVRTEWYHVSHCVVALTTHTYILYVAAWQQLELLLIAMLHAGCQLG